jgi:mannose-6-phosphate isomerase-like protein (cupin superfamily)
MSLTAQLRRRLPVVACLVLAAGWASREVVHARSHVEVVASQTVTLDKVKMEPFKVDGKEVGTAGAYVAGDTPASTKFITGRFVLNAGQTPHPPHIHVEEEVMIVESGTGEIFCDGKTTKVGPGTVMYTTPNASHGIVNTGATPLVFYFVKWAGRGASESGK